MARLLAAVTAIALLVTSCGDPAASDRVATDSVAAGESSPTAATIATAVPTTAATVVPPATPTAVTVPTAVATSTAAVPPTATVVPTSTAVPAPATASEPRSTPAPPAQPAPTDSQEILATNGGETYGIACARCHAENGTGAIGHPGLIGVGSRYTTAAMINELTNGHRITFGFADTLSADEIAAVVAYVKATFP